VKEVCNAIWNNLFHIHMPMLMKNNHEETAKSFFGKWGFPNCIGAIDGKHIRIKCPSKSGSIYYNYKHYFSIVVQGVSDLDYRFMCIEVGAFGKQSDGDVFQSSNLRKLIESGNFNIPEPSLLPNTNVKAPYVMIGEEAYPLKTYLMRPFPKNNLNEQTVLYNDRLSSARQTTECTFGLTVSKWQILGKAVETDVETAKIITKCVSCTILLLTKKVLIKWH
jgi:hypothetical protein